MISLLVILFVDIGRANDKSKVRQKFERRADCDLNLNRTSAERLFEFTRSRLQHFTSSTYKRSRGTAWRCSEATWSVSKMSKMMNEITFEIDLYAKTCIEERSSSLYRENRWVILRLCLYILDIYRKISLGQHRFGSLKNVYALHSYSLPFCSACLAFSFFLMQLIMND